MADCSGARLSMMQSPTEDTCKHELAGSGAASALIKGPVISRRQRTTLRRFSRRALPLLKTTTRSLFIRNLFHCGHLTICRLSTDMMESSQAKDQLVVQLEQLKEEKKAAVKRKMTEMEDLNEERRKKESELESLNEKTSRLNGETEEAKAMVDLVDRVVKQKAVADEAYTKMAVKAVGEDDLVSETFLKMGLINTNLTRLLLQLVSGMSCDDRVVVEQDQPEMAMTKRNLTWVNSLCKQVELQSDLVGKYPNVRKELAMSRGSSMLEDEEPKQEDEEPKQEDEESKQEDEEPKQEDEEPKQEETVTVDDKDVN